MCNKTTFNRKIVNIYILIIFGAVKLTKNSDMDKYYYSGYATGLDSKGSFLDSNGLGRNAIIFGADMSSSTHTNNKIRKILVLGKNLIQGIDSTTIYS